ncbi:62_t:CDS:2 [Diversispora eburnea]|uniref:62_t:CDS:1 n=1 Tax=Diversispora eburnea TaxID=1213867 RepID=A0A9N9FH00_9GLOM|nr:62_t:CDS:2 [Diversispora eburnea]
MCTVEIKQSHLVDSIKNNYYVPPVIFSCKKMEDNGATKTLRVCIDGKQRLTSIRRFFDNEIPHVVPDGPRSSRKYYSLEGENCFSEYERENIFDFEYWDLTLAQEQEIFSRVQLGMPLTNAEKLASISSPTVSFAQNLYTSYSSLSNIIEIRRGKPLELISQALYMIENEPEKQCFTHNNITKYLKDPREVPMALRQVAKTVFETLDTMIMDNVFVFHEEHKLAPIEFVFFSTSIASDTTPNSISTTVPTSTTPTPISPTTTANLQQRELD